VFAALSGAESGTRGGSDPLFWPTPARSEGPPWTRLWWEVSAAPWHHHIRRHEQLPGAWVCFPPGKMKSQYFFLSGDSLPPHPCRPAGSCGRQSLALLAHGWLIYGFFFFPEQTAEARVRPMCVSMGLDLHFSVFSYQYSCRELPREPTVPRWFSPPVPSCSRGGFRGTNSALGAAPAPHPRPGEENAVSQRKVPSPPRVCRLRSSASANEYCLIGISGTGSLLARGKGRVRSRCCTSRRRSWNKNHKQTALATPETSRADRPSQDLLGLSSSPSLVFNFRFILACHQRPLAGEGGFA